MPMMNQNLSNFMTQQWNIQRRLSCMNTIMGL